MTAPDPAIRIEQINNAVNVIPDVNPIHAPSSRPSTSSSDADNKLFEGHNEEQIKLMEEVCIILNYDDKPIGSASKKTCHILPNISAGLLHRAFSVFLFNDKNELLLQQRADEKITFANMWTNTCCSHPLAIPTEIGFDLESSITGVKNAARRKLEQELGISPEESAISSIAKKASIKKSSSKVTAKEKEQKTKKIIEAVTASHKNRSKEEDEGSDVESEQENEEVTDSKDNQTNNDDASAAEKEVQSFLELGVSQTIQNACDAMNFKKPTPIQAEAIPYALEGRDIIGLAQTGSGKTAAFGIPILQALWNKPSTLFACVLAPTRELAYQISQQFEALGSGMGLRCAVIVGGMDMMDQALALTRKPHIVVATPGRLMDHLEHTKGFSLRTLKYLVLDEADRLLDMDFEVAINKILTVIPKERNTYLFSATMTSKVDKLQRASLSNPVRVAVSSKYDTVDTLLQYYMFIPFKHKDTYLVYLINEMVGNSIIIFVRTRQDTERTALILRSLGFSAVPLHGQISQTARLGSLNKFKAGSRNILVATDVVARGLDIPSVDVVINYDIPTDSKAYIHRVGRTARAGRSGKSISLVTQYDIDLYQRIEAVLQRKLDEYSIDKEAVMLLSERVNEAQREAVLTLKANMEKKKSGRDRGGRRGRNNDDKDLGEE